MSDERWTKITPGDDDIMGVLTKRYKAAEGQRVETIRWCATHDWPAVGDDPVCSSPNRGPCVIVEATLILPPEAAS